MEKHMGEKPFCFFEKFPLIYKMTLVKYIYIYNIYIYYHHHNHHVVPLARISLNLPRHFSLSFIASGRSSGPHPVSSHSCWMYLRAGRPAFAWPYVGVDRSTSLMRFPASTKILAHQQSSKPIMDRNEKKTFILKTNIPI